MKRSMPDIYIYIYVHTYIVIYGNTRFLLNIFIFQKCEQIIPTPRESILHTSRASFQSHVITNSMFLGVPANTGNRYSYIYIYVYP